MLTRTDLQRLRSLRDKKHREAAGLYVVEGHKVVNELIAAGTHFTEIYATEDWQPAQALPRHVTLISRQEMERISHFPTPSPVFAVGQIRPQTPPPGVFDQGLTLALDGIQDPGNVGTLLRIADWYALDRVLLSPDCADLFSQKVINASMGSFARVTVFKAPLAEAFSGCRAAILGCDLQGGDVHAINPLRDAVIVIGSEGRGLSPAVKSAITIFVTIPRYGGAESLNAGVAAAIVCDNLRRNIGGSR